ncbi:hypothetical protein DICSQDRAFT_151518, partial [Dichomitus squalens LYAD-421 SS1]|uniref:uncharacterized protein n=1 Tax=Dichomitus squalens (strain LYAD-421) TaxID=732165 RepID=UPI0004411CF0
MRCWAEGHRKISTPSFSTTLSPDSCGLYRRSGKSSPSMTQTYPLSASAAQNTGGDLHRLGAFAFAISLSKTYIKGAHGSRPHLFSVLFTTPRTSHR